jgi:hypothetical protein
MLCVCSGRRIGPSLQAVTCFQERSSDSWRILWDAPRRVDMISVRIDVSSGSVVSECRGVEAWQQYVRKTKRLVKVGKNDCGLDVMALIGARPGLGRNVDPCE